MESRNGHEKSSFDSAELQAHVVVGWECHVRCSSLGVASRSTRVAIRAAIYLVINLLLTACLLRAYSSRPAAYSLFLPLTDMSQCLEQLKQPAFIAINTAFYIAPQNTSNFRFLKSIIFKSALVVSKLPS